MTPKPNRLAQESSPYLKQHALNPVDWYPWGTEALDRARREKKPIFLSIGYSACHWCHVMEHESFEDAETAQILKQDFISIKVDREERPDIDHIYMSAVQAMTQHGGWPLSVFLTPDLKPFYGGTYFPPVDRQGMPSFKKILTGLAAAWKSKPTDIAENAAQLTKAIQEIQSGHSGVPAPRTPTLDLVDGAVDAIGRSFDSAFGGLGSAPKFFHSMSFRLCLRHWHRTSNETALTLVTYTLDQLSRGGIRDQLGGGFHRYSTDAEWLVPHFEKMLYDNALLSELYLEAYQVTQDSKLANVARSTLDYVLREMTSEEGGFYSTQDADSEGVEGKFYVWSKKECLSILGDELGELFCKTYDVTLQGNWEGNNIPRLKQALAGDLDDELSVARRKLLAERGRRIAPGRDEKILLSWNGLMLTSLALGYQVLHDERYLEAARKSAAFLLTNFFSPQRLESGKPRLLHSRKDDKTRFNGYLDDYAFFLNGLISLYESDLDPKWIQSATDIADGLIEQFWEAGEQSFYFTGKDHESLIARPRELQDGATPAGQSIAVTALLRLSRLTGNSSYEDIAQAALNGTEPYLRLIPTGMSQMMIALQMTLEPSQEIVLLPGENEEEEVLHAIRECFIPNSVFAAPGKGGGSMPLLEGRTSVGGKVTLYVCEERVCLAPIVGRDAILEQVRKWKKK